MLNVPASTLRPAATPIADALHAGCQRTQVQLQALPLSGGASIEGSAYQDKYKAIFGDAFLRSDAVFAGAAFDSFFFPETVIRESEILAARAFSARDAMFVTSGTTVANQIALGALLEPGARVLADRACHQSIHFSLHGAKARVDYLDPVFECELTGRGWWSLDELVDRVWQAQERQAPYDLLVLNGQSYDGIVYRIPAILQALVNRGARVRNILVDEAWGTFGYFHHSLRHHTAMQAAAWFPDAGFNVVATHSVHKSTSCLRQGSMILSHGEPGLVDRLRHARYKLHTTSPSYPILAALDLARAQMTDEGAALTDRAERMAARAEDAVDRGAALSAYRINRTHLPEPVAAYAVLDPTKVSINVSGLSARPADVKDRLHADYGIWVRRSTASSILLNVHVGINDYRMAMTLDALRDIQRRDQAERSTPTGASPRISEHFVIPYPPGVPIVMPGEVLTPEIEQRIEAARRSGAHVFSIA